MKNFIILTKTDGYKISIDKDSIIQLEEFPIEVIDSYEEVTVLFGYGIYFRTKRYEPKYKQLTRVRIRTNDGFWPEVKDSLQNILRLMGNDNEL